MEITSVLMWLVDKILQVFDFRTKIRVLVHEAYFRPNNGLGPYYFIKVTNLSPVSKLTITHLWVEDEGKRIDILNPLRILPCKLESTDVWETWIAKNLIRNQEGIFENVRVMLSDGKVYGSHKNIDVPPIGYIA